MGCAVVEGAIDAETLQTARKGLYEGLESVRASVGVETMTRAGELGVVRAPMLSNPVFFSLLDHPRIIEIVNAALSPSAILHLQNGFVLPPAQAGHERQFQRNFHMDFKRVLNGFVCSINALIAIDDFTEENGATIVVPGSHQNATVPDTSNAIEATCAAGSVLVFDSTLWHAAGDNRSEHDRCAVNQQYTHSYFKPQLDYVRCLGNELVLSQRPRVQQLLGWYTRVPASLEEYYQEERVYRAGQG